MKNVIIYINAALDYCLVGDADQGFLENFEKLNPDFDRIPDGMKLVENDAGERMCIPSEDNREGFSEYLSDTWEYGMQPDGKGGWELPPAPDATTVLNWQLSAALAVKGVSFNPTDPSIAARWQYEPSFAIDGVVAKALQTSLGYDDAQLQALFNEAAALK